QFREVLRSLHGFRLSANHHCSGRPAIVRQTGLDLMAAVFMGKKTPLDRVLDPIDNAIYKVSGVNPLEQQRWPAYVKAMLLANLAMFAILFVILEVQQFLPLNPDSIGNVDQWL